MDPRELDIRRWWRHDQRKYENGGWLMGGASWVAWRSVGHLMSIIDELRRIVEPIAKAETERLLRVPSPRRVPSSDDTITMTPPTAMLATPDTYEAHEWAVSAPPSPGQTLTDAETWNAAVAKCQMGVERALAEASKRRLDVHGIRGLVERHVADCRKPTL